MVPAQRAQFQDSSDDRVWVLSARSDTEPGETYLFDRRARTLQLQYRVREKIRREALAPMQAILDRNLMSCILSCRAVAPAMMARREGRIVTVSSVDGLHGVASGSMYATAKAAVIEYSRCLAVSSRGSSWPRATSAS